MQDRDTELDKMKNKMKGGESKVPTPVPRREPAAAPTVHRSRSQRRRTTGVGPSAGGPRESSDAAEITAAIQEMLFIDGPRGGGRTLDEEVEDRDARGPDGCLTDGSCGLERFIRVLF
ncbi:hypothetical protein EYF80_011031 [Liparis tanakae]|uniref:Uncharacterized protein n=1 Tax=Liparis tanakae TaxID=230148 RepID=A0A4Z2IM49_9TELE|nr:hypothetical protein EYF80_011031 [Liparis tanakae]